MSASNSSGRLSSGTTLSSEREEIQFTVVIPALNEESVIKCCLKSLQELNFPSNNLEVILVDNGSGDRTVETARAFAGSLRLNILSEQNCRVTRLRNIGAKAARGKFLAFLDADCVPPREWLSFAARQLSTSNPGIVGGHCGIPENSTWVPRIWYSDRRVHKRGPVSYVPGANLLIRRADFQMLGGFDESLETNEECELCERARKNGLMVTAYPELGVVHLRDPHSLRTFYSKQTWHGKHVLKVFLRNLPSAVNARPIMFALYTLLSVFGLAASIVTGRLTWFGVSLGILFLPCVVLSLRIAVRRGRWSDFPLLVVLHLVYGLARASALVNPMNWTNESKTSERVFAGHDSSCSDENSKQTSPSPRL